MERLSNTDLRHALRGWLLERSHVVASHGILFDLHSNDQGDKPAAWLDLHGEELQVQVIVWASNEVEIHSAIGGAMVGTKYHENMNESSLRQLLEDAVLIMQCYAAVGA